MECIKKAVVKEALEAHLEKHQLLICGGGLSWKRLGSASKGADFNFVTAVSRTILSVKEIGGCHLLFLEKTTFGASHRDQNAVMLIETTPLPEGYRHLL